MLHVSDSRTADDGRVPQTRLDADATCLFAECITQSWSMYKELIFPLCGHHCPHSRHNLPSLRSRGSFQIFGRRLWTLLWRSRAGFSRSRRTVVG